MDVRLQMLSYSGLLELHRCPRRFQLIKLNATANEEDDSESSVTFAFGHAVGTGIQDVLMGKSLEETIWNMLINWPVDPMAENEKQKKSLWHAVHAIQMFHSIRNTGSLRDYELVFLGEKPAVEMMFIIKLPNGFRYRGFVDAVLRHRITNKIMVLENKTTASITLSASQYKNSSQAIGYSIVLDSLFPELSSYDVKYLIYKTKEFDFEDMTFGKSYLSRAQWIQELLFDAQDIERYENAGVYPMRGENCKAFNRDCKFFGLCTMNTVSLSSPIDDATLARYEEEESKADVILTLEQLITNQLEKTS